MMPRGRIAYVYSVFQESEEPINYNVQHHNVQHFQHEISPSKYHILYVNINSMQSKLDDLELLLHRLNKYAVEIHIVALTNIGIIEETSKYYNLTDYNSYYSTNLNGEGGVALFIHKSLTSGVIENLENDNINCLVANIPRLNVNVGILYQDPIATTDSLVTYYKRILRVNQRTILTSNVNIDLLTSNATTKQYTDAVREQKFSILNQIDRDSATRVENRRNGRATEYSIMDHVLSNVKQFNYSLSLCNASFSDNKILVLGFDDKKPEKIKFTAEPDLMTYKMVDFDKFNHYFSEINLHSIRSIDSLVVEMMACKRKSTVERQRRLRNKPYAETLDKSKRFEIRSKTFANRINGFNGDPGKRWEIINEFLTNKSSGKNSVVAMYNRTKQMVVDKTEIADIYNGYVLNIGKVLHGRIPHMTNLEIPVMQQNPHYLHSISTTYREVEEKIHQMKNSNSYHDSIPANTLKRHAQKIAPILARCFNDCFRTGYYPDSLKIDRIVPAFKSLDPLQPKNYRPICIAPALSKLMESIICDRITAFCLDYEIIDKDQYGFQKNSSAISAVVAVLDYLQVGLNANPESIGAGLFIDLKKASNTIPHKFLMDKLSRIGIQGSLYNLIQSYLFERRQYVDIDGTHSRKVRNVSAYSIPQGSSLGPLFFLLYINDIFKMKLHGKIVLFADDTAIVYVESDPNLLKRYMENDLKLLNRWFTKNALTLNTEKTKAMLFNAGHINVRNLEADFNLKIRNRTIEFVAWHKYLGIHLQSNLKWDVHINKIIREISAASTASQKLGRQVNADVSCEIYQKLVFNKLLKMASIYGTYATKMQLKNLQAAQDMAIKKIFAHVDNYNVHEIYANYKLLKVKDIISYDLALLIYKVQNKYLKLNRRVTDINGNNILNVAWKYFLDLPLPVQMHSELIHFKRHFKRRCYNIYHSNCSL